MTETATTLSPNASQRILKALQEAKHKIAALERTRHQPIAIIGMGCRFPGGADTPQKFWENLVNGRNAITDIPGDRFDLEALYDPNPETPGKIYIRKGGFLDRLDYFDPHFFRISPREAECLDPQQRLTLEVGWEALQHARQPAGSIKGSRTGIFIGMGQNDFAGLKFTSGDLRRIDAYDGSGNLSCFAAGRLGYFLGAQGPNLVVDTACSSSLVTLHLACQSLRNRECDMALAGGVHLVLSPEMTVFLCRTRVLAPDGICKTFDASANGFARGEGCGILVLKRHDDAVSQGDNILAVILGSAVNHDGKSGGLTVPNETAQAEVIRAALQNARLTPEAVSVIEAHGTGTELGDPIEVSGLAEVFGNGRRQPLLVSSVKTNIGHLEAAAGVAGVIKTILAGLQRTLPPHLHFRTPSPKIPWEALPMTVPTAATPWPEISGRRIAGVSSFGMSGTNAHIVLESPGTAAALMQAGAIDPGYRRERLWIAQPAAPLPNTPPQSSGHPLIGKQMPLPYSAEIRFEASLTATSPCFIKDHLIFGHRVVPAASHLAAILTAAQKMYQNGVIVLQEVLFSNPLIVGKNAATAIQLIFSANGKEKNFRLVSRSENDQQDAWVEHACGRIENRPAVAEVPDPPALQGQPVDKKNFYHHLELAGFDLGPAFQWGSRFIHQDGQAACAIARPAGFDDPTPYAVHPGLLDSCFQLLSYFWETAPVDLHKKGHLLVPFNVDTLTFYQTPDPSADFTCRARALPHERNGGDLDLIDPAGRTMISVAGFRFRKARSDAFKLAASPLPASWFYTIDWQPAPLTPTPRPYPGEWIIIGGNGDIDQNLYRRLKDEGHSCKILFSNHGSGHIDLEELWTNDQPQLSSNRGIIYLWGLDHTNHAGIFMNSAQIADTATKGFLQLVQLLLNSQAASIPTITVATDVGWCLSPSGHRHIPAHAPLWGLCRSIMREHPEIKIKLVDLDPNDHQNFAQRLFEEINATHPAVQVAYSGRHRHTAVLSKMDPVHPKQQRHSGLMFAKEATYLITGGLGGLGLALAQWLIDKDAGHIVLLSRHASTEKAHRKIKLPSDGSQTLRVTTGDVCDFEQLRRVIDMVCEEGPPLKGVFHAAGVTDDAILLKQNPQRFKTVMAPKVQGAWHLHTLTAKLDLDYFVLFSSAASLLGSPGQSNYAAANSFLDGLSHFRHANGLPAHAVNWGPFERTGMTLDLSDAEKERWQTLGMSSMPVAEGFAHLEKLLAMKMPQAAIIPGIPSQIIAAFNRSAALPEITPASAPPSQTADSGILEALRAISTVDGQETALKEHIHKRVAEVLKMSATRRIEVRQPLFDAGLDSLMAVELKNILASDLDHGFHATLVFDYPTIEALAGHIQSTVLREAAPSVPSPSARHPVTEPDMILASVEAMTDEAILQKLTRNH